MRPRPKYEPYVTRRERSEINIRSFNKVIENLHNSPRRFDVFTPDGIGSDQSHFRDIAMASTNQYKVLLLRNPFYRHTERDDILLKLKTEPNWQPAAGRGLAPRRMIATRSTDPTSLPALRDNRDVQVKPASRGGDRSVRFRSGLDESLPSINAKQQLAMPPKPQTAEPSVRPAAKHLPVVTEATEDKIDTVAKVNKPRPATSDGSRSTRSRRAASSATSSLSSLSDSSSQSGDDKRVEKSKQDTTKLPKMPERKEPNLLEDPDFRKNLLQKLEGDRKKRIENTKWGLVANTFKASAFLKIQMPDVIKDASTSKHHNRAIEQVQERIKARADAEARAQAQETGAFGGGFSSNLVKSKGMSQSMPVLAKY